MRLFFAVKVTGAEVVLGRVSAELRKSGAKAKWVEPNALHLTLAFLGEQPAERISPALAAAKAAVFGREPFKAAFVGLGVFPSWSRARVVWAGVSEGSKALTELGQALHEQLKARGFKLEERAFVPHLTLARLKSGHRLEELKRLAEGLRIDAWQGACFEVSDILLIESKLSAKGTVYTEHSRVALHA